MIKNVLLVIVLVAASVGPCFAQKPGKHEAEFRTFYARFLAAVRANDKEQLAALISFPTDWSIEQNHDVQTGKINDKDDFLARYKMLFTTYMRNHIPRAKLKALGDGRILYLLA